MSNIRNRNLNLGPLACDRWDRIEDNIWAIAKHIDALRGQRRWGVGSVEQAFAGYAALPEPTGATKRPWWEVLGVASGEEFNVVQTAYRGEMKHHHPDVGGDPKKAQEINVAWEEFKKERGLQHEA